MDCQVKDAAATVQTARAIKAAAKSLATNSSSEGVSILAYQATAPPQVSASTADAISAITDRFPERLLEEHQRQAIVSTKSRPGTRSILDLTGYLSTWTQATTTADSAQTAAGSQLIGSIGAKVVRVPLRRMKLTKPICYSMSPKATASKDLLLRELLVGSQGRRESEAAIESAARNQLRIRYCSDCDEGGELSFDANA